MEKNTIIAIVLSTLVIIGGFTLQSIFFPTETATSKQVSAPNTASAPQISPDSTATGTAAPAVTMLAQEEPALKQSVVEEKAVIDTPLVHVEFTNKGGDIISYKLKGHSDNAEPVEMAEFVNDDNRAFSVLLGGVNGTVINELFHVKKISDTAIGFYRILTIKNDDGSQSTFTLAKQYSFLPDDYMFEMKVIVEGDNSFTGLKSGYTIKTSPQIGPKWIGKQDSYEYRKMFYLVNGKKKTLTLKDGQSKGITDPLSWAGVAGKYFTLIALPETPIQSVTYSTLSAKENISISQLFLTKSGFSGRQTIDTWHFYIGPRTEKYLGKYNIATNNSYKLNDVQMVKIVEGSGILGPLEVLLKVVMEFFYKIIPNWGVSIIILTILMRVILFPLTKKSSQATHKMQELQPKIQEIQAKHKDNPQKMNEEMGKFYQSAGYNPLSGCLPLLIQFPLIFAMYNLFNNYFEFRGAMFIPGWIPDLSKGDSVRTLAHAISLFGIQLTDLRVLPVIYVISQLLFGKVTQTPGSAQQNSSMKFMMYGMPLMFFFIFYNAPAGLLIYWTFSNILTLIQQVVINRMMQKTKDSGLKLVKK